MPPECLGYVNSVDFAQLTTAQREDMERLGWTEEKYRAHLAATDALPFVCKPLPPIGQGGAAVPPLGHHSSLTLPLDSAAQFSMVGFRTTDADLATGVITEAYNRGIFTLPEFAPMVGAGRGVSGVRFNIKMLCSDEAHRVVVQESIRFRFMVHLNQKRGIQGQQRPNFDEPATARSWAKFLRKRPELARWFVGVPA